MARFPKRLQNFKVFARFQKRVQNFKNVAKFQNRVQNFKNFATFQNRVQNFENFARFQNRVQNLKNLGGHRGQNIFWKLGTNCDFNEVGTLQDLEDGKAKTDKKFDKCCRCGQLEGCMVAPLGG